MTNAQVWETALRQSARDSNCRPEDFCSAGNVIVRSAANPLARRYLKLPFLLDLTSYGTNVVASVSEELEGVAREYLEKFSGHSCFETPALLVLSERLKRYGCDVCFMAEYFLPDVSAVRRTGCEPEIRMLGREELREYYLPEWRNALCRERSELDRLAAGAFDGGKLVGLAGCSADCSEMWQIGVDVLPEYRRRGIASALTAHLAAELLEREIVPFYCCAWSNLASARNAIRSGFRPAWVQLTAKKLGEIRELNQI